jgi:hypothetical protein
MFHLRRLRTRSPSSVETIARKPSHLSSKDHPEPEGRGPERHSIGSGSRRSGRLSPRIEEREQLRRAGSTSFAPALSSASSARVRCSPGRWQLPPWSSSHARGRQSRRRERHQRERRVGLYEHNGSILYLALPLAQRLIGSGPGPTSQRTLVSAPTSGRFRDEAPLTFAF